MPRLSSTTAIHRPFLLPAGELGQAPFALERLHLGDGSLDQRVVERQASRRGGTVLSAPQKLPEGSLGELGIQR